MKRVIVTGSRKWRDEKVVYKALSEVYLEIGPFTLVRSARSTGAGYFAHQWYEAVRYVLTIEEVTYKANWDRFGKKAGPMCDARMVGAGADLVLAFPHPAGSGTQHTMELARAAGIEIRGVRWRG